MSKGNSRVRLTDEERNIIDAHRKMRAGPQSKTGRPESEPAAVKTEAGAGVGRPALGGTGGGVPPEGVPSLFGRPTPDPEELVIEEFSGQLVPRSSLEPRKAPAPPDEVEEPDPGESEEPKKPRKEPAYRKDWEGYVPVLRKLPLLSHAHERENVLRYLARAPPMARTGIAPLFGEVIFGWHTEGLSDDERLALLRMNHRLARDFYFNLTHRGDGLDPHEPMAI